MFRIVRAAHFGFVAGCFVGGESIRARATGGGSLLIAAALTLRVDDVDDTAAGPWHPGFPPAV